LGLFSKNFFYIIKIIGFVYSPVKRRDKKMAGGILAAKPTGGYSWAGTGTRNFIRQSTPLCARTGGAIIFNIP
jgi:hypothetical protein